MKTLYIEAKQKLSSCMMHDNDDAASMSPTSSLGLTTQPLHSNHNHSNNKHNNNTDNSYRLDEQHYHQQQQHNHHHSQFAATCTYDTLQRPFKADKRRGRWSMPFDFYAACTSHSFGTIIFSEILVYAMVFGGVYVLPAYLFAIVLYAIPIFIIQTFLGQFSTSGTISALRVAPIFKGIGYSILILNVISLTYYAVNAAVPLVYALSAVKSVIPWMSCDNTWNTANCSTHSTYDEDDDFLYPHATVEYFRYVIGAAEAVNTTNNTFAISWPVLYATLATWLFALGILLRHVSFIGKFFRCTYVVMLSFFITICVQEFLQADISRHTFLSYFEPILSNSEAGIRHSINAAFLMASWMLGPGWGSILTLASHNHFRRDSEKYTYWVSATHVVLAVMAMLCGRIALDHFEDHVGFFHFHVEEEHFMQFLYICFAYYFGSVESLPNMLSFLFFIMLFIAELSAVIIQVMSVLTALFDEYESLRTSKKRVTIGFVCIMMLTSVYFCSNHGFSHMHMLPHVSFLMYSIISFVLLIMTTWIYGRERFQRDLQFMLGKTISNFKMFLLRFVTPTILIMSSFTVFFLMEQYNTPSALSKITQCIVYGVAPLYMLYKVCRTTGSLRNRLRQCFKPHDWHPVDLDNRRFYDELMGNSEMLVIDSDQQQQQQYA